MSRRREKKYPGSIVLFVLIAVIILFSLLGYKVTIESTQAPSTEIPMETTSVPQVPSEQITNTTTLNQTTSAVSPT